MNFDKYLNRIGAGGFDISADLTTLKRLQKLHLLHVPFENLDIHWKTPIALDIELIFQKIVENGRGGFCYELNGLFFELLLSVGFDCKRISARVFGANGDFGPEFDHLAILTKIEGTEYLTDVGFGEFSAEPLKFVLDEEQTDENGVFVIRKFDDEYFEVAKKVEGNWKCEYIFKDLNREFKEFSEMCDFHQTSPESHFTRGKVCSLMTGDGRKTLTDKKFIETRQGEKSETEVDSEEEFNRILEREFLIKSSE